MKLSKHAMAITGGVIGLVLLVLLISWIWGNSVTSKGNKLEATLSAMYPDTQQALSDCEAKTAQAANVVGAQSQAVDKILLDAVKGRYDKTGTVVPDNGKLFSAIVEAYPNLNQVSGTYRDMLTVVTGCRSDFRGSQSKLLDQLRTFEAWRTGSWSSRHYAKDFPNDNLKAQVGSDSPLRGKDAEDKMFQVVLTSTATTEYKTGKLDPSTYQPFPTTTSP